MIQILGDLTLHYSVTQILSIPALRQARLLFPQLFTFHSPLQQEVNITLKYTFTSITVNVYFTSLKRA